ncbi:MAG: hypothetical protein ABSH56_23800 [Bryobacteraceae bacterium]|jgi:hypothetical protein
MISLRHFAAASALLLWTSAPGVAAVAFAGPFGEHMVLQQGVPVPIWGAGCPGGDNVTVSIAGQSVGTRSDWAGGWMVRLAPMKAGGPYQMLIETGGTGPLIPSSAANSRGGVELNDVLVGEVWLTAGPSGTSATQISGAGSPWIHVFRNSHWMLAARDTATGQAAQAYSFAHAQHEKLKVPIGLIDSLYPPMAPYAVRGVIWDGKAYSGPVCESLVPEGTAIRLRFRSAEGGLTRKRESLAGFFIAGEDRKFVAANAEIEGEEVVVSSPNLSNPVAVRFGYDGDPPLDLCNRAGEPASPFRTDDW